MNYYTIAEIAERFDETIEEIEKWIEEGRLYYIVQDKTYLFPSEQMETFEQINEIDPTFLVRREEDWKELREINRRNL